MRASESSLRPKDQCIVPEAKTIAPLDAVYLTAPMVPGCPGGGVVARRRPSSWIQLLSGAVWTLVAIRRLTFAGWRDVYCAWVGAASHSQLTKSPMLVVVLVGMPVLRHTRSPANSPLAFAAGTVTGNVRASLSPTYMFPKSWFSGISGPTRPPGGAPGSPCGAPLSRNVVVEFSG
jgi:hypothetical protein